MAVNLVASDADRANMQGICDVFKLAPEILDQKESDEALEERVESHLSGYGR